MGAVPKMALIIQHDQFSVSKRSWIMSRIKSGDNPAELALRKALWKSGLRYRVHSKRVLGSPDVLFINAKVAVFVDGAFWHGRKLSEDRLSKMSLYWQQKLSRNKARDLEVNNQLKDQGYLVVRYSEQQVLKKADAIAANIESIVRSRSKG